MCKPDQSIKPSHRDHPSRRLTLVVAERYERENITELIAALCMRGPLYVLAGSDWLPGYGLTRLIRHQTHEVRQTLKHVRMARAFTCYQLLDLIANLRPNDEPLLILDFLNTFLNDDIPLPVRFRVLRQCCEHLQRLAFRKPAVILVQERSVEDYAAFSASLHKMQMKSCISKENRSGSASPRCSNPYGTNPAACLTIDPATG